MNFITIYVCKDHVAMNFYHWLLTAKTLDLGTRNLVAWQAIRLDHNHTLQEVLPWLD